MLCKLHLLQVICNYLNFLIFQKGPLEEKKLRRSPLLNTNRPPETGFEVSATSGGLPGTPPPCLCLWFKTMYCLLLFILNKTISTTGWMGGQPGTPPPKLCCLWFKTMYCLWTIQNTLMFMNDSQLFNVYKQCKTF